MGTPSRLSQACDSIPPRTSPRMIAGRQPGTRPCGRLRVLKRGIRSVCNSRPRASIRLALRRCRIDDRLYFGDAIGREAPLLGMVAHHLFIWRDVDAINLVVGDIALQPLNLWPEISEHSARFLRDRLQLVLRQFTGIRNLALDNVL